jgi:hypothetical protein
VSDFREFLSDIPPVAGSLGLVQGAYGDRGNLELCFPDPGSGLWVCWFNNDPPGATAEVSSGSWSQGLRFGRAAYQSATIIQARRGPDYLEVVACTGEGLHRWTWQPEAGFTQTDVLPSDVGPLDDAFCMETETGLVVVARASDQLLVWDGADADYPTLSWSTRPVTTLPDRTVQVATTGLADETLCHAAVTASGDVLLRGAHADWVAVPTLRDVTCVAWPQGGRGQQLLAAAAEGVLMVDIAAGVSQSVVNVPAADAIAAAWSTTDAERRLELIVRTGHQLSHHRLTNLS